MSLIDIQRKYEEAQLAHSRTRVLNTFTKMVAKGGGDSTPEGQALKRLGLDRVQSTLEEYFRAPLRGHNAKQRDVVMVYKGKEDVLAFMLVSTVLQVLLKHPQTMQNLATTLSKALNTDMLLEAFHSEHPKLLNYIDYEYRNRGQEYILSRKRRLAKMTTTLEYGSVDLAVCLRLLELLLKSNTGMFEVKRKAHPTSRTLTGKVIKLYLTEESRLIITKVQDVLTKIGVLYKPLVVTPKPWDLSTQRGSSHGGYHFTGTIPFVRHKSRIANRIWKRLQTKHARSSLLGRDFNVNKDKPLYLKRLTDVINGVQNTEWRTNRFILNVAQHIVDNNIVDPLSPPDNPRCIGGIPHMEFLNVDTIVLMHNYGELYTTQSGKQRFVRKEDYKRYYTARETALTRLESNNSKRVVYKLALALADEFSVYDKFHFSYSPDFRSRLYPVQQLLNPQSSSNVKALLEFKNGVVPTDEGIYWIKIAVANTAGQDKESYEDRIEWVESHMQDIQQCADSPLESTSIWGKADEPLMFLSGCKALRDGLRGIPVHFPIPLDGKCSGIQIYSGLLRDKEGAEAVSVVERSACNPNSNRKPADIYNAVVARVNLLMKMGFPPKTITFTDSTATRREIPTSVELKSMEGNITRSLVKRNVMTQPYSVTAHGMYAQLRELFEDIEANTPDQVFWRGEKWVCIRLLVILNTKAISDIVKGATKGQEYIKKVASMMNKEGKVLQWTTPFFDFPVIQAQTVRKERRITTSIGKLKFLEHTDTLDKLRQSNAIAPNLIHSLDATLLYLTVERLLALGVKDFSLIHDSFGVDCNSVGKLNIALRESFVELFESDPLLNWYQQLQAECDVVLPHPDTVMINTLDLKEVMNSRYIFS